MPEIENVLQDMLGLNETEVWRNPDRYGSGESYDPYMDGTIERVLRELEFIPPKTIPMQ